MHLELLRSILHSLLNFNKPTDKLVIFFSQQLDEIIIKYYKVKANYDLSIVTTMASNISDFE